MSEERLAVKLYLVGSTTFFGSGDFVVLAKDESQALKLARDNASLEYVGRDDRGSYLNSFKATLLTDDLDHEFVSEEFGEYC